MLTLAIVGMTLLIEGIIFWLGIKYGFFPKKYKKARIDLMKVN